MSDTRKYNVAMRVVHWLMAALILAQLAVGLGMDDLDDGREASAIHMSLGVLVLATAALRVLVRLLSKVPPLPAGITAVERLAAHVAHGLLYLLMFAVPVCGWLAVASGDGPGTVAFFGMELPGLVPYSDDVADFFEDAHETLVWVLCGVLAAHVAGALKHRLLDGPQNDPFSRMV